MIRSIIACVLIIFSCVIFIYYKDSFVLENKGSFFNKGNNVNGKLFFIKDSIFVFNESSQPALEFADYDVPSIEDLDSFQPPFKEEWMESYEERSNRSKVLLFKQKEIEENSRLVFEDIGQDGFLWSNKTSSRIYILVDRYDAYDQNNTHIPTLWVSNDEGERFKKQKLPTTKGWPKGMFFDNFGKNGFIFIDDDIYQTQDFGVVWNKIYLSEFVLENNSSSDIGTYLKNSTIDKQGSLYFSTFVKGDSYIYKLPFNGESIKLINVIQDELILNLSVIDSDNYYYVSFLCNESRVDDCISFYISNLYVENASNNPILKITSVKDGKEYSSLKLNDAYIVNSFEANEKGQIAATLENTSKKGFFIKNIGKYILITSEDFGVKWTTNDFSQYIKGIGASTEYIDINNGSYFFLKGTERNLFKKKLFK